MTRQGDRRNDGRTPRLPKDPDKARRAAEIREWATNNGCSIAVARAYWEDDQATSILAPDTEDTGYTLTPGDADPPTTPLPVRGTGVVIG